MIMLKRFTIFAVTLASLGAAVVLAPSSDQKEGKANYRPVADWPRLPENIKLGQVTAVATDAADRVYVFHRGKNPILILNRDGKLIRSFGDDHVKNAHGLRLDHDGNIWITDLAYHLVMKFDPKGKLLLTLGTKGKPGEDESHFNKPTDVAFSPAGDIYVSDGYGNSRVVKFTAAGKYLKSWGKRGKGEGEFNLPHAICCDASGTIYVGDRENNRIQVFDSDGKYLSQWQETGAPFGLFLTPKGTMLLADGRAHLAKVLDLKGKSLSRWGEKGAAAGQFDLPHAICMDSRGAVFVTEITGKRVQKFVAR
jgi:DNA-binding beta-propeller fold protein YncE